MLLVAVQFKSGLFPLRLHLLLLDQPSFRQIMDQSFRMSGDELAFAQPLEANS